MAVAGPGGAPGPNQDNSKLQNFRMLMAGGYNAASQNSPEFAVLVDLFKKKKLVVDARILCNPFGRFNALMSANRQVPPVSLR